MASPNIMGTGQRPSLQLLQREDFYDGNAGRVVYPADDCGVLRAAGRQRSRNRGFQILDRAVDNQRWMGSNRFFASLTLMA